MEIPANYVVRHSIVSTIETHIFEYILHVSIFGEVLRVENLFLELPKAAQRLVLGKDYETMLSKIESYAGLFRYKVPLAAHDFLEDEEIAELVKKIKAERKKLGIFDSVLDDNYLVSDEWTNQIIWRTHEINNDINLDLNWKSKLEDLAIILNKDETKSPEALGRINHQRFHQAAPIIRGIMDDLSDSTKNYAYPALSKLYSEDNKQFFIERFEKKEYVRWRPSMIDGLSLYNDHEIYTFVMEYYFNNKDIPESELVSICHFSIRFKTKEVEKIGWRCLLGQSTYVGGAGRRLIVNLNIPEEQIAFKINEVFYNPEKTKHLHNIILQYKQIKNPKLIPSTHDIFTAMEKAFAQRINLSYHAAAILIKKYNPSVPSQLYQMLLNESKDVRGGAIHILLILTKNLDKNIFAPSEKLIARVIALSNDNFPTNQLSAIELLGKLSAIKQIEGLVELLLSKVNLVQDKKAPIAVASMNAINIFFQYHPFDETIIPTYLEGLRSSNVHIKMAALNGLKYSLTSKIKAQILSLKNDKNSEIRQLVQQLQEMPTIVRKIPPIPKETPKKQKPKNVKKQPQMASHSKDYLFSKVINFFKKNF